MNRWQVKLTNDNMNGTSLIDQDDNVLAQNLDPESANYIATACTIYDALMNDYLAIADSLARKTGITLPATPLTNKPDECKC